ncbi:hypothetical protein [Agrobacterium larrymoorei]|uniref:Uncharacterized protein n=1 Tax=Agrobacterium larrymoorei TaxID=160699 RepID=A0AAF0KDL9_9HYPH|nr:hypothetical protein [Agrobacterium larrymoorei]WHA40946.1 hypothetical protein CFBP5477_014220 [Agrobacterium larrymoorei]
MTSAIHNPFLESLKKALHREASQVGFLAIEDVDRVFALIPAASPVAWYWEDDTGCFHMTMDRPDVVQMAAVVNREPKPLYPAPLEASRFFGNAQNMTVNVPPGALAEFTEYFARNYPGPDTVIYNPYWHAPKIFRAAINAFASQEQGADDWSAEEKLTAEEAWQTLCETPDITSPEEYPDHALITFEQLRSYMERAAPVCVEKTGSETCPICLTAFKLGDVLRPRPNAPGPVHAACLESKPDIDRETGKIIVETLPTFLYGEPAPATAIRVVTS